MSNNRENESRRPLDTEELTSEQVEKVAGGINLYAAFNTVAFNASAFNGCGFNSTNINV